MGKIKLLLADKSEIFREGLAKLLERERSIELAGICRTGLEAVESTIKHKPDVVLMDSELSECSCDEAIRRIHQRLPTTSVIVLSNSEANTDFLVTVSAGARGYVSKNITVANLVKTITLVAEEQVIISPMKAARLLAELESLEVGKHRPNFTDFTSLSQREKEVLALVARGATNKEIAATLFISENTVKVHMRNIMGKLQSENRQQAANRAIEQGLLSGASPTNAKQV